MTVTFVTALVLPREPSPPHRSIDTYRHHFQSLVDSGIDLCVFLDERISSDLPTAPTVRIERISMDPYWVSATELPSTRNPTKDTVSYMSIQLAKLAFVTRATELYSSSHFAWIDFGVFHMFRDTHACQARLRSLASSSVRDDRLIAPGCWPPGSYDIWDRICWRFCGSFVLGHRSRFLPAYTRQCELVRAGLPRLTWEVNYWSQMDDHFAWYPGDHTDLLLSVPESVCTTKPDGSHSFASPSSPPTSETAEFLT